MGRKKKDIPVELKEDFVASAWIARRDNGGLKYSRESFYRDVKLWEFMFREFHKDSYDGLSRKPGIVENFTEQLKSKFGHYDHNTLHNFAFVRTMARVKTLQRHLAGTGETCRSITRRIEFAF